MCGIFGAVKFGGSDSSESDFIQAARMVSHRGADNFGNFNDWNCFLGHTRLSILFRLYQVHLWNEIWGREQEGESRKERVPTQMDGNSGLQE